ncbi:MAG TPA: hypothetical protein VF361_01250 [Candidatus Limnocylindrales bacterium]
MAKKERKTSRHSGSKTAPVPASKDEAAAATAARRTMAGRKGLRRRLRKLEGQLADAARQERKRLRKLERALWRRQRIEAAIDEIRTATALMKTATARKAAPPVTAPPVAAEPAAGRPVVTKRAPARRAAGPRTGGAAGGPRPARTPKPAPPAAPEG